MTDTTLQEFSDLGKVQWEERAEKIREQFPDVENFDWDTAFDQDLELFGRIMRDILKLEQSTPGRPGPRPSLDVAAATRRLQQVFGEDYTIKPFPQALKALAGDRSIRHLASITKLNKDRVHRLLKGELEPDGYIMRLCAQAFGKHPSYFLEWRILYITQAMTRRLEWTPETTIDLYAALDGQRRKRGK